MRIPATSYLERLVIYLLLAQVISRVVMEFGMGMWWFKTVQLKLWITYGLLFLDHAFWFGKGRFHRLRLDWYVLVAIGLFTLIALHGALIGLAWGQGVWPVFEDTAPVLAILLTIVRVQQEDGIDFHAAFKRMFWVTILATWVCVIFGYAGVARGLPTKIPPQGAVIGIYLSLYLAYLARAPRSWRLAFHSASMAGALLVSLDDINRTTMAFMAVGAGLALLLRLRIDKIGTIFLVLALGAMPVIGSRLVPEDSKTYSRLVAVFDETARSRSISIQARTMEDRDIKLALEKEGAFAELFGLGHGASYEYRSMNKYEAAHAHAHYAFAYFNLRYGFMGKFYVVLIGALLLANIGLGLVRGSAIASFCVFVSILSFLYLFTYVNFFIYLAGLPVATMLFPLRTWRDSFAETDAMSKRTKTRQTRLNNSAAPILVWRKP